MKILSPKKTMLVLAGVILSFQAISAKEDVNPDVNTDCEDLGVAFDWGAVPYYATYANTNPLVAGDYVTLINGQTEYVPNGTLINFVENAADIAVQTSPELKIRFGGPSDELGTWILLSDRTFVTFDAAFIGLWTNETGFVLASNVVDDVACLRLDWSAPRQRQAFLNGVINLKHESRLDGKKTCNFLGSTQDVGSGFEVASTVVHTYLDGIVRQWYISGPWPAGEALFLTGNYYRATGVWKGQPDDSLFAIHPACDAINN